MDNSLVNEMVYDPIATTGCMSSVIDSEQESSCLASDRRFQPTIRMATENARIMIVDDEPINIEVVREHIACAIHCDFVTTSDPTHVLDLVAKEEPDLILLDIMMPGVSGLDILEELRGNPELAHIPVLILTATEDDRTKCRALELGATDYLGKPVNFNELITRVRNTLVIKAHHDHLKGYAEELERQVRKRTARLRRKTAELAKSRWELIHCLARAAEYRDNDTGRHVVRVGRYAGIIACQLGLHKELASLIESAAPLHDVGKIGIPDSVLLKPGKLAPEEFELMKRHGNYGKRILEPMNEDEWNTLRGHTETGAEIMRVSTAPIIKMAASIALTHHERWDGSGYPLGLSGADIPIEGRITAVADVFDALSSRRPYKPAFPLEKCFTIMNEGRGTHFDPDVLDAFLARRQEIVKVQIEYADVE